MIKRTKRDQRRTATGLSPEAIAELNGRPAELTVAPPDPDSDTAWMADGNCRLHPPATFFPSDGVGVDKARKICRDCPVMATLPRVRARRAHRPRRVGRVLRARASPNPQVAPPRGGRDHRHRLTVGVPDADRPTHRHRSRRYTRRAVPENIASCSASLYWRGQLLHGVPVHGVRQRQPVDGEVALEHAPLGAEALDGVLVPATLSAEQFVGRRRVRRRRGTRNRCRASPGRPSLATVFSHAAISAMSSFHCSKISSCRPANRPTPTGVPK